MKKWVNLVLEEWRKGVVDCDEINVDGTRSDLGCERRSGEWSELLELTLWAFIQTNLSRFAPSGPELSVRPPAQPVLVFYIYLFIPNLLFIPSDRHRDETCMRTNFFFMVYHPLKYFIFMLFTEFKFTTKKLLLRPRETVVELMAYITRCGTIPDLNNLERPHHAKCLVYPELVYVN
jgi:hypothetical protein